jgi:hypothetical protein
LVFPQGNFVDSADPDAGHPDRVAVVQARHVGENRGIRSLGTGLVLAEDQEEPAGQQRHDDGEDAEFDDCQT